MYVYIYLSHFVCDQVCDAAFVVLLHVFWNYELCAGRVQNFLSSLLYLILQRVLKLRLAGGLI